MLQRCLPIVCLFVLSGALTAEAAPREYDVGQHDTLQQDCKVMPSPCPGPNCQMAPPDPADPEALGRRIVYLSFDGLTLKRSTTTDDARTNESAIVSSTKNVAAFQASDLGNDGGGSRSEIIDYTVTELRKSFNAYDVEFVTTRPSSGNYHMVVFLPAGFTCDNTVPGGGNCVGIAIRDCDDFMPNNIVLAFTWDMRFVDLPQIAAHEVGHALGLDHILNEDAIMFPAVQQSIPTNFATGTIPSDDQANSCTGNSTQNSPQVLMNTIGPRGQDVLAPIVDISSPTNGQTVIGGTQVVATVTDLDGQIQRVEFLVAGNLVDTRNSPPWNFTIPVGTPLGETLIALRAYDTKENSSQGFVQVIIEANEQCGGGGDCPTGQVCESSLCIPVISENGDLGETCDSDGQCDTGLCGQVGDDRRCTQFCTDNTGCPQGFSCLTGGACWPADGGGGCSTSAGDSPLPRMLLVLGVAAMFTRRRRRSGDGS